MITGPTPLLLLALGLLLGPGLVVGAVIGLRGWLLAAAAPALTMGFVAAAGMTFVVAGLAWTPGAVLGALAGVGATGIVATALHRFRRERRWSAAPGPGLAQRLDGWRWHHHAAVAAALGVCGALGVHATFQATEGFTGVNQTWDAFFHAGAIRFIAESGDPAPASLAVIGAPAATDFYMPDAYHCVAALLHQLSGAPVVTVINALVGVLPLLLGLGLAGLLRVATGRPAHAVCVALLSAVVAVVPYHMVGYGTLLPYATALVMLPGVLALVIGLLRAPGWRVGVALGVAAAGLLHTHPQVAFLASMIALIQLGWHLVAVRRGGLPLLGTIAGTAAVAGGLGAPVLVALAAAVGRADAIDWPVSATVAGAVGELLIFNAAGPDPQWVLAVLLFAGFAAIVARPEAAALRPFVAAAVLIGALFVLAAASDTALSLELTSLWWNDRNRLAGAFGVLAAVFAAVGIVWLSDQVATMLPGRRGSAPVLGVVLAVAAALTGGGYLAQTTRTLAQAYEPHYVLSDVERDGLAAVDRIVRASGGGTVMNDPHDGCGWGYALYGTEMVFRTPLTGPYDWDDRGHDRMRLYERFDRFATSEQITTDVVALDIRWAVLCTGFIRPSQTRAPGLFDVGGMPGATRVYADDEVRLYRIDISRVDVAPPSVRVVRRGTG